MLRKRGIFFVLAIAVLGNVGAASAFSPAQMMSGSEAVVAKPDLHLASFFGRPYPYGYTGWAPCTRYVEVQTRWGTYLRRVRVCR